MDLHRLLQQNAQIAPEEAISNLRWGDYAPPDRPYLALNMVSTADGKAAVQGRTVAISSSVDRAVFHNLRTQADAVMAGANEIDKTGVALSAKHRRPGEPGWFDQPSWRHALPISTTVLPI